MQRYIEMGYSEHEARQADELYGDDLHAGCHWLMLRQTLGKMPKRLKLSHDAPQQTFLGSTIRFEGIQWDINGFDKRHALIRILSSHTSIRKWIHISDSRIEWVVERHESVEGNIPKPSWYRKIGQIQFDITRMDESKKKESSLENILNFYLRHHRPEETLEYYKWRMLAALTKKFQHQPSRSRPRQSSDIHAFRAELMSLFHALCDVCDVSKDTFNDLLYNAQTNACTALFPESEKSFLKEQINIWKRPRPFLLEKITKWRKECVPVIIFKPSVLLTDSFICDVIIHDLTFVRPSGYEVSMNIVHLQCLFNNIYTHNASQKITSEQMDEAFLNNILKKSRKTISNGTVPSDVFVQSLYPYQQKCLTWLIERENNSSPTSSWGWTRHELEDGFAYYTSCFGYITQSSPNTTIRGGILSQDVGMGKTIEMLSLIATNPCDGPTLIVVPTTMLTIWLHEAEKNCPSLKTVRFHGARRRQICIEYLKTADIVVTTYRICVNETQRHIPTIGSIRWGRIILDESHELKNPTSATVKAMCRLYAPRKWCLSATPFPKGLINMASILSFMGVTPFVDNITPTFDGTNTPVQMLFRRQENSYIPSFLSILMTEMIFWQQKRHVRMALPTSTSQTIELDMAYPEIYNCLCSSISIRLLNDSCHSNQHQKARILHYIRWLKLASTAYILNPHFVYALIQDSNRAQSTTKSIDEFINSLGTTQYDHSLRKLIESWLQGNETCCICRDAIERPTLTPCQHLFCYECIQSAYEHDMERRCPLCRTPASNNCLNELKITCDNPTTIENQVWTSTDNMGFPVSMPMEIYNKIISNRMPPKIQKILEMVQNRSEKFVIFTQYHSVLKLLLGVFNGKNIPCVTIEGRMTPNRRASNIQAFQTSDNVRVFIMTTKTASVGITLTAGTHIIFVEPCQESHIKKQAIGRILRIGQTHPVIITTLVTKNSFESKNHSEFRRHIDLMTSHD